MAGPHGGCPVLIVEDDPDLREMMCLLLETEGFVPEAACDGLDALNHLRSHGVHPHVIVLDMMMPRMDGQEFLHRQANDPKIADIPVVVLSAATGARSVEAAAVLQKPLNCEAFLKVIRDYC